MHHTLYVELKTQLTKLRSQTTRGASDWRSKALHLAEMDKLEGKKFDHLKKITEAENRRDGVQARLVEARDEEEELNRGKPLERGEFDRQGLLLSIYRKVGFHPIYASDQTKTAPTAPFKSLNCVPASRKRTTLHRVDEAYLRETGQTPFWTAEQLWKAVE
ncbi:hypothetical protein IE81DRAFT_362640 [Ceraceosorus guamensis]|uniref:Kinetochore protein Spc24 n=1 Tax=Ceraceosorus guamensis TaxID=1522189 RepID=A0A316W4J9_9BASI|nr:hypothetical protein IE81DRAFT_362640 [Ceraceosorus guamensis]PWN44642.1 hypothetical protein IE81DRAFT_362640 [Ceraceosorus guamensis]